MKYLVIVAFVLIIASLASALVFIMREGGGKAPKSNKVVNALAMRVGLSVALFVFILVSYKLGWIAPTGIPIGR